jgi:hypothetical protein
MWINIINYCIKYTCSWIKSRMIFVIANYTCAPSLYGCCVYVVVFSSMALLCSHDVLWHVANSMCTRETKCTAGVFVDRMNMDLKHDECCDMFLTLSTCNSWSDTAALEYALRYLGRSHQDANVFRRLKHLRKTYSTCDYKSPTDSSYRSQWRCHDCISAMWAVENLTRYGMKIGAISIVVPRKTSWPSNASLPLLAEFIFGSTRSLITDVVLRMTILTHRGGGNYTWYCHD